MWLDEWTRVGEILLSALLVYVALVLVLRITGKRTTSKMNSFDWVVTVALGSMVGTIILVDEVPLVEGIAGIAGLVVLQYAMAATAARFPGFQNVIKATPRMLYYGDEFFEQTMKQERITRVEILAAARSQGFTSFNDISAVVLETNSDLSILPRPEHEDDLDELLDNVNDG